MRPPSLNEDLIYPEGSRRQLVHTGSSKDFYATGDAVVLRMRMKDVMHGRGRTRVVEGTGRLREEFCYWFYRLLEREGIRTHIARKINEVALVGDQALLDDGILVRKMDMLAIELIARFVTRGHWVDGHKYPLFPAGVELEEPVVEMCLKWKQDVANLDYQQLPAWQQAIHSLLSRTPLRGILQSPTTTRDDPRINADVAVALHRHAKDPRIKGHMVVSRDEAEQLRQLTLRVNEVLQAFLESQGWKLEDGKFEVGIPVDHAGRDFVVGDEYTQDSSRVRDGSGNSLTKDLHRNLKPASEVYDGYARLAEAIRSYVR